MANEISTVQSLKAVDAWIDVINANINGGVRTAFKTSRLKFGGSNTNVARTGNSTSLPLQFPEPGLTTANSVIDFSQGAITASTENAHLAVQGEGYFLLVSPDSMLATGKYLGTPETKFLMTRDGEFHANKNGLLVNSFGYFLCTHYKPGAAYSNVGMRGVYDDMDITTPNPALTQAVRLTDFLTNTLVTTTVMADGVSTLGTAGVASIARITLGEQSLRYSSYGSTFYDFDLNVVSGVYNPAMFIAMGTPSDATILNKSLEASNASMTQSVPELSLAQKLFSALTKVLQVSQTNTDAVINLVR